MLQYLVMNVTILVLLGFQLVFKVFGLEVINEYGFYEADADFDIARIVDGNFITPNNEEYYLNISSGLYVIANYTDQSVLYYVNASTYMDQHDATVALLDQATNDTTTTFRGTVVYKTTQQHLSDLKYIGRSYATCVLNSTESEPRESEWQNSPVSKTMLPWVIQLQNALTR